MFFFILWNGRLETSRRPDPLFTNRQTLGNWGNLAPGRPVPCRNADGAICLAERAIAGGVVVGAHILRVLADEEAGDYGEPEYLDAFGTVPEPE